MLKLRNSLIIIQSAHRMRFAPIVLYQKYIIMNATTLNNQKRRTQGLGFVKTNINIEQLFEMAIEKANKGDNESAEKIARDALIAANQNNEYIAVYIHGFLAVLCMEKKRFTSARIHIYNAQNKLDKRHYSYTTDVEYFEAILKKINKIDIQSEIAA